MKLYTIIAKTKTKTIHNSPVDIYEVLRVSMKMFSSIYKTILQMDVLVEKQVKKKNLCTGRFSLLIKHSCKYLEP